MTVCVSKLKQETWADLGAAKKGENEERFPNECKMIKQTVFYTTPNSDRQNLSAASVIIHRKDI